MKTRSKKRKKGSFDEEKSLPNKISKLQIDEEAKATRNSRKRGSDAIGTEDAIQSMVEGMNSMRMSRKRSKTCPEIPSSPQNFLKQLHFQRLERLKQISHDPPIKNQSAEPTPSKRSFYNTSS